MGVSPTKTGELREDQFWVLKSCGEWSYQDEEEKQVVEPIITEKIGFATFKNAYLLQKLSRWSGWTLHGRRINDEVELFEWDKGKETPGLRKALEAKGLTVRTFTPEPETKSKPPNKATRGKDLVEPTDLEQCKHILTTSLKRFGNEFGIIIDHAILADPGDESGYKMVVCRCRAEGFYKRYNDDFNTIPLGDDECHVIGAIEGGEVRLKYTDEAFISLFSLNSNGSRRINLCYRDVSDLDADNERATIKAEKKRAKKHRRQVTASTVTSPSEISFASQSVEDDEAIKARQREKRKAKNIAQKGRRRAAKAVEEEEDKKIVNAALKSKKGFLKVDDEDEDLEMLGTSGSYRLFQRKSTGKQILVPKPGVAMFDLTDLETHGTARRMHIPRIDDSSNSSSDTEAGDETEVVKANTVEEIDRMINERKGAPIVVAGVEGMEAETKSKVERFGGLKFLGRGL